MRAESAKPMSIYLTADNLLSDNPEVTLSLNRARDFFICLPNEVGSFTPNESAIVCRQGMFLSAVGWSAGINSDHRWVITGSDELFDVTLRISRTFPNVRLFSLAMSVLEM
jgi:hypothetical protein